MTASPAVPLAAPRPRAITELLEASIQLWRREWTTFGALAVAGATPLALIALAAMPRVMDAKRQTDMAWWMAVTPFGIAGIIFYLIADAAVVIVTSHAYLDTPISAVNALRAAWKSAASITLVTAMKFAVVGGPIVATIALSRAGNPLATFDAAVATLVWSSYWLCRLVTVPAPVVLEELDASRAFRRSLQLTNSSVKHIARAMAPIGIIYMVLSFGVDLVATLASQTATQTMIVSSAGQLVFLSVVTVFATLLYYDLRVVRDGFDAERPIGSA
ncbi:MAG: hypothetical protein M3081_17020 [Gemmatimonadota bacterium]|nr:hypothetical protein [Gemmatimonadota bacterium]